MIELKISGAEPREFFKNAAEAFMLLAHGGQNLFAAPPGADVEKAREVPAGTPVTADGKAVQAEPVGDVTKTVVEKAPRKNAKNKAPETIDAKPEVFETVVKGFDPAAVVDDDPLGLNDVAKPADEKTYTVDDMRQRVKDILAAHGPKTKESPSARGNEMPVCVAYVRKLFAPFNVKLAADVPPDRFAEFMAASQPYLDGSAE